MVKNLPTIWKTWVRPELGRSPGGRHGNPLQYSCLENPHGEKSLGGYSLWSCKESDKTERLSTQTTLAKVSLFILIKYLRLYQPSVVSLAGWYYRIWQIIFSPATLYPSQTLFFYFRISHHWITLISIKTWLKILSSICFLHLLCPFHSNHRLVQLNNSMGVLFSYICALI